MPGDLGPILNHLPAWLMVLFRLTGIFVLAPLLGSRTVFRQVKVFLVLGLSLCIYPMLLDPANPSAALVGHVIDGGLSLWTLGAAVGLELLVGLIIGYGASLPLVGMQMGGHVIDQQVGLGIAGVFNPELGAQSGPLGEALFLLALTIFTILGGHRVMLSTLIDSFQSVPLGGLTDFGSMIELLLGLLASMFEMALRIAAPLLCLIFLETVAMGFIARTVPQINILSIGFAVRILMGMGMMVVLVAVLSGVYVDELQRTLGRLARFFGG